MKRLYYLAENLDQAEFIGAALARQAVKPRHFHVLSQDEAGLYRHHLHSATPFQERDLLRSGERGALLGIGAGFIVALAVVLTMPQIPALAAFAVTVVLLTGFGLWAGSMAGLSMENPRIRRFQGALDSGRHLLMVDVPRSRQAEIAQIMRRFAVTEAGSDTTMVLPFALQRA